MKFFNATGLGVLVLLFLFSCEKAKLVTYERDANIYFDLDEDQRDSIVYTFAYDMTRSVDTVFIPVRVMGYRDAKARAYRAYVETDSSTAQPDIHYKRLESQYPMSSMAGQDSLPVIVYNVADLEERSVSLIVKLQASDDFGIENPALIRARILFSARLEQPEWWSMWLGEYSRTKHQLFLIVTEQRSLTMDGLDAPKNLYFVNLLTMMLNDPFKWVEDHPEKGYVLTSTDGEATYQFYHRDNPSRTILLKRNEASGRYFFMDEAGKEVR